jgi:sigma-E factor negative regulatory protein RseC
MNQEVTEQPMLEQTAEVIKTAADGIWVQAVEPSGCGTCAGQGCSSRRIAELFQRKPRQFLVDCDLSLSPGDRVIVGIANGSVLKSALRAYGLPLALMLAGALLAQAFLPGDGFAVLGVLAGGVISWLVGRGGRAARPVVLRREEIALFHSMKG